MLVTPHRIQRPRQGQQEKRADWHRPEYDESCYLCPGNIRSGGQRNPDYSDTFVFTNDFPALLQDTEDFQTATEPPRVRPKRFDRCGTAS